MKMTTKTLTQIAIIAAIYVVLTFVSYPIAFSNIQFRLSEAMTILPIFTKIAIPGLTLGCALANLIGYLVGINPAGLIDALFGTSATFIACILTYYIGKSKSKKVRYILAPMPPVIINAIIIGLEISIVFMNTYDISVILINSFTVFIGQVVICYGLGIPLIKVLEKNDLYKRIFRIK